VTWAALSLGAGRLAGPAAFPDLPLGWLLAYSGGMGAVGVWAGFIIAVGMPVLVGCFLRRTGRARVAPTFGGDT
jgi:Na+-driven multidrug efflux pump